MAQLDPSLSAYAKDTRSPLARAMGERGVVTRLVDVFDGTGAPLDGIPLALRMVSDADRTRAVGASLRYLIDECRMSESYLYDTTAGGMELDIESKLQILAVALCEPAPPHDRVVKDADELRALITADDIVTLYEVLADFVHERSPLARVRSAEEVDAVIEALGKGTTPPSRLQSFDASTLRSAVVRLASRLATPTNSSSSRSPRSTDDDGTQE